ncbi:MAG: cation transporter, partial [Pseudomonadaceae bacterium]|nr:cation transporter [Pseudomonadaceae bacterium]NLC02477.1 cation transporter [Halopseudomonas formosensis]
MRVRQGYRLPADREALLHKAIRLEWISLGFVLSIVLVMYLSMGSSQTMKMALLEDLLALVPPVVFLLAMRMRKRPPDEQHPYGYSRAIL